MAETDAVSVTYTVTYSMVYRIYMDLWLTYGL